MVQQYVLAYLVIFTGQALAALLGVAVLYIVTNGNAISRPLVMVVIAAAAGVELLIIDTLL